MVVAGDHPWLSGRKLPTDSSEEPKIIGSLTGEDTRFLVGMYLDIGPWGLDTASKGTLDYCGCHLDPGDETPPVPTPVTGGFSPPLAPPIGQPFAERPTIYGGAWVPTPGAGPILPTCTSALDLKKGSGTYTVKVTRSDDSISLPVIIGLDENCSNLQGIWTIKYAKDITFEWTFESKGLGCTPKPVGQGESTHGNHASCGNGCHLDSVVTVRTKTYSGSIVCTPVSGQLFCGPQSVFHHSGTVSYTSAQSFSPVGGAADTTSSFCGCSGLTTVEKEKQANSPEEGDNVVED